MANATAPVSRSFARAWASRPLSRLGQFLLIGLVLAAPWWLFFDPIGLFGKGHVARDPIGIYRVYSDDFAYAAASRTFSRTVANLFVPHNTHVVPAWRFLTWLLVSWSGSLERLPEVLAEASYGILVAVMLIAGHLVARETGRASVGMAAMLGLGTTSLMLSVATWYSAGQTLWAGFGILATLWYAQLWRCRGSTPALVLAAISAILAGWCWTIGHMAGPAAAFYLWQDGRRRCRMAAVVPLLATVVALLLGLGLGGSKIDSKVSFHGRTTREAAQPIQGLLHSAQAIPENLICGNLGLSVQTTQAQGVVLTVLLFMPWLKARLSRGGLRAFNPLESAGAALLLGSYLVEWTVRGYMPYQYLRTISVAMIVPWYDTIPQIGFVLLVVGWSMGPRATERGGLPPRKIAAPTRLEAVGLVVLMLVLLVLNRPRVDRLWGKSVPPLLTSEQKIFRIDSMKTMRTSILILDRAAWQRRHLRRLDQAQDVAARLGIGREQIKAVFGRVDVPELPAVYDAADLLDLPERGREIDPAAVRRALSTYLTKDPEPRPAWLSRGDPWPPPIAAQSDPE